MCSSVQNKICLKAQRMKGNENFDLTTHSTITTHTNIINNGCNSFRCVCVH